MGKFLKGLFAAMMLTTMCACSGDDLVKPASQVETSLVQFSFFDTSVEKLDDYTRGATRAGDVDASTWKKTFSRLDLALFSEDNDTVYRIHQDSTNAAYGKISLRLPIRNYQMVAIASKASGEVNIASATSATFPGDLATDMAYVSQAVQVKSGTTSVNSVLKRSVSKFKLQATDTVPYNVSRVEITLSNLSCKSFNPSTGFGVQNKEKGEILKTFNIKSKGTTNPNFSCYAFLSGESETVNVGVKVFNLKDEVIKTLTFDNVVLQKNYVTTYTGPLFSSGSTLEFKFDNQEFATSDENNVKFDDDHE